MAQQRATATTTSAKPLLEQSRVPSVYVAAGICVLAVALGLLKPLSSSCWQQLNRQSTAVDEPAPVHTKAICTKARPPFICAHGGDTTQHPPNTAAAYKAALQAGADCMEIDAALTADAVLVALHDRDLQKLLDQQTVKVQDLSWADLQSLTWPSGERLLTVAEAVQRVQDAVDLLIIDVKASADVNRVLHTTPDGSPVTEAATFLGALQQLQLSNTSIIWGKSDELVAQVYEAGMPVLTGYTVMRLPGTVYEDPLRLQTAKVAAVYHGVLDTGMMEALQGQQKTVVTWTVDGHDDMKRMLELGVDGLVTNAPRLLQSTLEAALLQCREL